MTQHFGVQTPKCNLLYYESGQKLPKARIVFKVFESDSYTEGHWKLEKVMEKLMEFEEIKRAGTDLG